MGDWCRSAGWRPRLLHRQTHFGRQTAEGDNSQREREGEGEREREDGQSEGESEPPARAEE